MLRCAAGWSATREGQVEVLGQPLREADRQLRRELVLVTDTPPFYYDLTAREHVSFVLRANHLGEREAEAERLLGAFGLKEAAGAYSLDVLAGDAIQARARDRSRDPP